MMNPAGRTAGALIVAASMHSSTPSSGRPPGVATASPATINPIMSASLWPPPMKWNSTSGLQTPSHTARAGSLPADLAKRGSEIAMSTTPATSNRRRIMIALTTLPPERRTASVREPQEERPVGRRRGQPRVTHGREELRRAERGRPELVRD